MSNHPFEYFRILTVLAIAVAMSFASQAYGIFAGSLVELKVAIQTVAAMKKIITQHFFLSLQLGLLFAALLLVYQIIFAGGLVFMKDVNPWWHWMFEVLSGI